MAKNPGNSYDTIRRLVMQASDKQQQH